MVDDIAVTELAFDLANRALVSCVNARPRRNIINIVTAWLLSMKRSSGAMPGEVLMRSRYCINVASLVTSET